MKILIDQIRNKKNITQKQLSKITGISERSLRHYISGDKSPTLEKLKIIAEALDVKVQDLFVV